MKKKIAIGAGILTALLAAGGVDYVVTLDAGLDSRFANCTPMDAVTYDGGEGPVTWYLYRVTA